MITYRQIWFISLLAAAALLAGPAVGMAPADRQHNNRAAEMLLFYSNDVRGEIEPCG